MEMRMTGAPALPPPDTDRSLPHDAANTEISVRSADAARRRGREAIRVMRNRGARARISRGHPLVSCRPFHPAMKQELAPRYDPAAFEERIYASWEKGGYFTPVLDRDRPKFSIVIPPPNVTGRLHIGHALVNTLQDIIVRWKRMSGFSTLWVPGTDHAGIATQMVVERKLAEQGISRFDL